MKHTIPEQVKRTIYVWLNTETQYLEPIDISDTDRREWTPANAAKYVLLAEAEITIDIPKDLDLTAAITAHLEKVRSGIVQEYTMKLEGIQERIEAVGETYQIEGKE